MKPSLRTTEEMRAIANRKVPEHPDIIAPPHEHMMMLLGEMKESIKNLKIKIEEAATKVDVQSLTEQVKKQNGNVAHLLQDSQIHTIAIARIDERNENIDKADDRKILTTQNIISAASVLIAIVTLFFYFHK
jgi:hypothetical protein